MKSFIFYFALATLAVNIYAGTQKWTEEEKEKLKKISQECQKISKVTDEEIKNIREKDIISDSPAMKKHLGCIAKKVHLVRDDGTIDKDIFCKKLELTNTKENAKKILKDCAEQMADSDETGYHLLKCAIEKDHGFKPTGELKS